MKDNKINDNKINDKKIADNNLKEKIKSRDMAELHRYIEYLRENPRLTYLFLELTSYCNLKCAHCGSGCGDFAGENIDTEILFEALQTVAEDFDKNSMMICITGGEPMLHPRFKDIVKKVVDLGFSWGMTTNATLIDDAAADFLKEMKIGSITISIDGLEESHDELRKVKGSFKRTASAVRRLNERDIPVQVTTVIHRKNYGELEKIYKLMQDLGVKSWRVINIEPIGRANMNQELMLSKAEFDGLIDFIREKRFANDTPLDVTFGCSHYLGFEAEREVRDNYFICGSGIMVGSILANGDIFSCLDIVRRPELIQGNIRSDRFSEVWYNRFKEFREDRSLKSEECRNCKEREFCGGDSGHTWDYDNNKPLFCRGKRGNNHVFQ